MNDLPRPGPARADLRLALGKCLESSLHRLDTLWHDIGFSEEEKCQRTKAVFEHVHSLLDDLCSEEEEGRKKLKESADQHAVEYAKLCKELSVRDEPLPSNLSLLAKEGELRHRASELQKERHRRVSKARSLVAHEESLCSSLCKERQLQHITRDFVPSVEQLQQWQQLVDQLAAEKDQRVLQLSELQQKLQQLWSDLGHEPSDNSFEKALSSCDVDDLVLTDETLERGQALVHRLEKELAVLTETANLLRSQIVQLWQRLDIAPDEQDAAIQESGHKASAIAAMRVELERLEELKRQHMGRFIHAVREELVTLWDRARFGPKQREEFIPAYDTEFNEELLMAHEQEAQRLHSFLEENAAIFKMVERREELWSRMQEILASAKNPNRFNNRGGQLLKEEKIRKALSKELPKVEKDLKTLLTAWEERHQEHFIIKDERYLDVITWQWENAENKREQEKTKRLQAKKAALQDDHSRTSQSAVTPVKRRAAPTTSTGPISKKSTTPSLAGSRSRPASVHHKTPSKTQLSCKSVTQQKVALSRQPLCDHNSMEASVAIAGNTRDVDCSIASVSTLSYNDFVQVAMSGARSSSIERPEDVQKILFAEG